MRRFIVCFHDVTPAHAGDIEVMIHDLAPFTGRCLSFGVVPDWHGGWPLTAYPEFCSTVRDSCAEILLHGHSHRRARGRGPVTWLTDAADEMNGLDRDGTRRILERGQRIFEDAFGKRAQGFLAPAWQRGHVRAGKDVDYVLGFFSLDSAARRVPVATWSWDCGRWGWLGHVGGGVGATLHAAGRRVPVIAIHPRDLRLGFWPRILGLTRRLLRVGYQPTTAAGLLEADDVEVAV